MALIFTSPIPTTIGVEMSNIYMVVDSQYSQTSRNHLEFNCMFFASKQAFESGAQPITIGDHPLSRLANPISAELMQTIGTFNFAQPKTVQSGIEVFSLMAEAYYELVKSIIAEIAAEHEITINYTQE